MLEDYFTSPLPVKSSQYLQIHRELHLIRVNFKAKQSQHPPGSSGNEAPSRRLGSRTRCSVSAAQGRCLCFNFAWFSPNSMVYTTVKDINLSLATTSIIWELVSVRIFLMFSQNVIFRIYLTILTKNKFQAEVSQFCWASFSSLASYR